MIILFLFFSGNISFSENHRYEYWTSYTVDDGLYNNVVSSIAIDLDNIKWVGHYIGYPGISIYDDKKWSVFYQYYGREDYHLGRVIAVDKNNVKWFSNRGNLVSYDFKYNAQDYMVRAFLEEHNGFPLFGVNDWIAGGDIVRIIIDDDNTIYVLGSGESFHSIRPYIAQYDGKNTIKRYPLEFDSIDFVLYDDNHIIYITRLNAYRTILLNVFTGGYDYDFNNSIKLNTDDIPFHNNYLSCLSLDKNKVIWVGYKGGVAAYDGAAWTNYTPDNSGIPSKNIYTIAVDYNNTKWIGTDAGVCRFDGETWTTFNTENSGLPDNSINAIAFEKNNTIWIGTNNGIAKYSGELIPVSVEENTTPQQFPVIRSYPNPFNPSTTIEFILPEAGATSLGIYNISGQKVRIIVTEFLTAGRHTVVWDGKDDTGVTASTGIYFARLTCGGRTVTGKMVMVK
ncbi:T9SS type A sorting domain-containing protein [bacterium]|nr:T9SS type A sorting domain-containing protein [bacterium]